MACNENVSGNTMTWENLWSLIIFEIDDHWFTGFSYLDCNLIPCISIRILFAAPLNSGYRIVRDQCLDRVENYLIGSIVTWCKSRFACLAFRRICSVMKIPEFPILPTLDKPARRHISLHNSRGWCLWQNWQAALIIAFNNVWDPRFLLFRCWDSANILGWVGKLNITLFNLKMVDMKEDSPAGWRSAGTPVHCQKQRFYVSPKHKEKW
jgi:hypothetical protein